jgi:hypothetical protein
MCRVFPPLSARAPSHPPVAGLIWGRVRKQMAETVNPHPDAQRVSGQMETKRREAVEQIAERNKQAHLKAKRQRQTSDRFRAMNRGPNPR